MTMMATHLSASTREHPLGPAISRAHLIGIGGAGMEALARLLSGSGCRVTGSDLSGGPVVDDLRRTGVAVFQGHDEAHIRGADIVIYSSAVPQDNVERIAAQAAGIPQLRRAEALGQISRVFDTVAIAGTHGKTTTSSMVAGALHAAGWHPCVAIGGWSGGRSQSAWGAGDWLVVEADEYDRSFLTLRPRVTVVTNIEAEHVDCYADEAQLLAAFVQLLDSTDRSGSIVINGDDPLSQRALALRRGVVPVVTFGFGPDCMVRVQDTDSSTYFDWTVDGTRRSQPLRVAGRHNVANGLAACAVAHVLGLDLTAATTALASFEGVDRRFERRGVAQGVQIVDDYAHHPTEIAATLAAARQQMAGRGRLIAVLQPHTYSRTAYFRDAFVKELQAADQVWVSGVYAARETLADGQQSDGIVEDLRRAGSDAHWVADAGQAVRQAHAACVAGDWMLVMGAGDIGEHIDGLFGEDA